MERRDPSEEEQQENQEMECIVRSAESYLKYAILFLSADDKAKLANMIALFGEIGDFIGICRLLGEKGQLRDAYVNKIMACLVNQECRTQLIMRMGEQRYLTPAPYLP